MIELLGNRPWKELRTFEDLSHNLNPPPAEITNINIS
jgi:hypothetical protein